MLLSFQSFQQAGDLPHVMQEIGQRQSSSNYLPASKSLNLANKECFQQQF